MCDDDTSPNQVKRYARLCPFHQEQTPSCLVNPHAGTFWCMSCGKRGSVGELPPLTEGEPLIFQEPRGFERAGDVVSRLVDALRDNIDLVAPEHRREVEDMIQHIQRRAKDP